MKRSLICLMLVVAGSPVWAAQEIITIESTITGSQEQPKVISIVPWQKPRKPEYLGGNVKELEGEELLSTENQQAGRTSLRAQIFQPIDRDAFNREMQYISSMRKSAKQ